VLKHFTCKLHPLHPNQNPFNSNLPYLHPQSPKQTHITQPCPSISLTTAINPKSSSARAQNQFLHFHHTQFTTNLTYHCHHQLVSLLSHPKHHQI
jgi:hypothetical protein